MNQSHYRRYQSVKVFLFVLFSIPFFIATVKAATFCVSCASELETALATAASNGEDDTVQVVQGNYFGNFVYASTEAFNISIEGGYTTTCSSRVVDASNTVLDGSDSDSVLVLSSDQIANFSVDGLTLQNGKAQTGTSGGGLNVLTNGSLTLTNSTVSGSFARSGGGVSVGPNSSANNITVTLSNNIISNNNSAFCGGGIMALKGTITLSNNTIINNSTESGGSGGGGGVCLLYGSTIILTNNTIKNNIANNNINGFQTGSVWVGGGGVYVESNAIILNNNTISDNLATSGGGGVFATASASITLNNNIISNNSADIGGGGVYLPGGGGGVYLYGSGTMSTVTLTNNTFADNTAYNDGGGLMLRLREETAVADIYNNIIWNNSATVSADIYINNDGDDDFLPSTVNVFNNVFDQSSEGTYIKRPFTIDHSNLNKADPMFIGGGNYHLTADSPCINTGTNGAPGLPETDKDGKLRIIDSIVDMGAYEYLGAQTVTGNLVTSDLWIGAVINTEEKGPIEAVWHKGGEDTTSRGDRVIWGHFYASPSDVTWGSQNNPDLFVKIWFDVSGRVDVNYFHVSVPDIEVYSDYPYDGSPDEQGATTMDRRYIRQYYQNGESSMDENYEDGNPPSGYSPTGNPSGYSTINDLRIGSIINTVEKGPIDAVWRIGGQDTTSRGDHVVWGHFYASPHDVTWGSGNNPDLFVKIWFDVSGRVDVNFFHVSVPDIEVYSALPNDGTYDQKGTTIMDNRYIRHEYLR